MEAITTADFTVNAREPIEDAKAFATSFAPIPIAAVNDTISQIVNHRLPFGGIRNSGLGSYHGKQSFKTFSFYKPYIVKSNIFDLNAKYKIDSSSIVYKLLKRVIKNISL